MAPTSLEKVPSPMPRVEEPTSTPAPNPPPTTKLEGAASPEEPPPRFAPLGMDDPEIPLLEDAYRPVAMPMGTLLDLTTLESLQMTISHILVTGQVHFHLQAQSIIRMSLPGASSQEQLESSPKIEEL